MSVLKVYSRGWYSIALILLICCISVYQGMKSQTMQTHLPNLEAGLLGMFLLGLIVGIGIAGIIRLLSKAFGNTFQRVAFHLFMLPIFCFSSFLVIMNTIGVYLSVTIGINSILLGLRVLFDDGSSRDERTIPPKVAETKQAT